MSMTVTLEQAREALDAMDVKDAKKVNAKQAQKKLTAIFSDEDRVEKVSEEVDGYDKSVRKVVKKMLEEEDEIVVEDEEETDDEDESDEEEESEDDDSDIEEDEPVKPKKGKKDKDAKASKNGKPKKRSGTVERDEFGRSLNSQAAKINECVTKEGQTAKDIAEECDAQLSSVTSHLRNMVSQGHFLVKKVDGVSQFFRKGGKAAASSNGKKEKSGKKKVKK